MNNELLEKILNNQQESRDLLIDELSDYMNSDNLSENDKLNIIKNLVTCLKNELNNDVHESIMNLLSDMYFDGIGEDYIIDFVSSSLKSMPIASIAHALPILANSNLKNRFELIERYCNSDNLSLAEIAEESMNK